MTATGSHLLLRAFCQELARCGVTDACTSPGSRNAPLILALAREPGLRTWSHIDERCAGFFALGLAHARRRPAAVACTSGTAAANLAPAVHEACQARVPMIVLTADRPPELRDVGAGQVIDQVKLFGSGAKWFVEVGTHEDTPERLRWVRALACRAAWTARGSTIDPPGVVHLNFALREPLVPPSHLPDDDTARPDGDPFVKRLGAPPRSNLVDMGNLAERALTPTRCVVVAGRGIDFGLRRDLALFSVRTGSPLLADPLSGARRGEAAIAHYDVLMRDEGFAAAHRPNLVLRVGDLPTSKPLRAWLAELPGAQQLTLGSRPAWQDPAGVVTDSLAMHPLSALHSLRSIRCEPTWLHSWRRADDRAATALESTVGSELSEPAVAWELGRSLPRDATLVVASSMPVRDVETFFPAREDAPRVVSNRGANGIDGTVSTAFGVAAGRAALDDNPTVLLIGDVALAHDIGGLLAASRLGLKLTVILLNNDGGGIFHFLPVSGEADAFEEHVATPHGLDFAHAAALYGCEHITPADLAAFREALELSLGAKTTTIIEVRTDRDENLRLHQRVQDAVASALA